MLKKPNSLKYGLKKYWKANQNNCSTTLFKSNQSLKEIG